MTFIRQNPEKNMRRFYRLYLQATLFGESSLVREFGRIGQPGRIRVDYFPSQQEAKACLLHLMRKKLGKGYKPLAETPAESSINCLEDPIYFGTSFHTSGNRSSLPAISFREPSSAESKERMD